MPEYLLPPIVFGIIAWSNEDDRLLFRPPVAGSSALGKLRLVRVPADADDTRH